MISDFHDYDWPRRWGWFFVSAAASGVLFYLFA